MTEIRRDRNAIIIRRIRYHAKSSLCALLTRENMQRPMLVKWLRQSETRQALYGKKRLGLTGFGAFTRRVNDKAATDNGRVSSAVSFDSSCEGLSPVCGFTTGEVVLSPVEVSRWTKSISIGAFAL